jgi:streptogramin lyase
VPRQKVTSLPALSGALRPNGDGRDGGTGTGHAGEPRPVAGLTVKWALPIAFLTAVTAVLFPVGSSAQPRVRAGYSNGPKIVVAEYSARSTHPGLLTAAADGTLWFTRETGGLGRFNPATHSVSLHGLPSACSQDGIVSALAAAPGGGVVYDCGQGPGEVVRLTAAGSVAKEYPLDASALGPLQRPAALSANTDGSVTLALDTDAQHLAHLAPDGTLATYASLSLPYVVHLAPAQNGTTWLGSLRGNLVRLDATGIVKRIRIPGNGFFAGVTNDRLGGAWAIMSQGGGQVSGPITVAHITASGAVKLIPIGDGVRFFEMTVAADNSLLAFGGPQIDPTAPVKPSILKVTPGGVATLYPFAAGTSAAGLAVAKNGTVWFTDTIKNKIGRIVSF